MARIRTVKPELWTDPEFVECSPNARLLFVAALNFASDYGVMADKPVQLKMQCFPGDNLKVEPLIDELVGHGFWVRRVAPDGANVLVIRTFLTHQRVDKPQDGRWGNPADWPPINEQSPTVPRIVDEPAATEWKGMEGKEGSLSADKSAGRKPPGRFEEFYGPYPRKEGKGAAEAAYAKALKHATHDEIMTGLERMLPWLRQKQTEGFCVQPARWLNEQRWLDEPGGTNRRATTHAATRASALERLDERLRAVNADEPPRLAIHQGGIA